MEIVFATVETYEKTNCDRHIGLMIFVIDSVIAAIQVLRSIVYVLF